MKYPIDVKNQSRSQYVPKTAPAEPPFPVTLGNVAKLRRFYRDKWLKEDRFATIHVKRHWNQYAAQLKEHSHDSPDFAYLASRLYALRCVFPDITGPPEGQ